MPVAHHGAHRLELRDLEPAAAGQLRHVEEAGQRLRRPPSSGRLAARRRSARSSGVSTSKRDHGPSPACGLGTRPPRGSARPRCRSGTPSRRASARSRSPGHDEGVGAEAVVAHHLAGDRCEQARRDRCRRAGRALPRRRSQWRRRAAVSLRVLQRSRAAAANQRPQWNGAATSLASGGSSGTTAAPRRPSRCESSAARSRCVASLTAAYEPNGASAGGTTTRISGATSTRRRSPPRSSR